MFIKEPEEAPSAGLQVSFNVGCELDPNEMAAVAILAEVCRCLYEGKPIDRHFAPGTASDKNTLVLCRWTRGGKLQVVREVNKKFKHVETTEEALLQRRSFTCSKYLMRELPVRRRQD